MSVRRLRDSGALEGASSVRPGMSGFRRFLRYRFGRFSSLVCHRATLTRHPATRKRFLSHDLRYERAHILKDSSGRLCHGGGC